MSITTKLITDLPLSLDYYSISKYSDHGHEAYHQVGGQPLFEMKELNYDTLNYVEEGERGDDDALIQYRIHQATVEGNIQAMLDLGNVYYYGSRGVVRDQVRSFEYYLNAAERGSVEGQVDNPKHAKWLMRGIVEILFTNPPTFLCLSSYSFLVIPCLSTCI